MNNAVRKIDPVRYRRLLSQTMPVVIETEEKNARTLTTVEKLMKKGETTGRRCALLKDKTSPDFPPI